MENSPKSSYSDLDLKIGIARALGLSLEKTAQVADSSESTVKRRIVEPHIQRLEAVARTILALADADRAEAVVGTAQERVSKLFDRAFVITERLIKKAEALGDEITLDEAMEIHKNLTVWTAKHVVSEAPKRMQIDSRNTTTIKHVLSLEEAQNLLETRRLIRQNAPALGTNLPTSGTEVIEAELADA